MQWMRREQIPKNVVSVNDGGLVFAESLEQLQRGVVIACVQEEIEHAVHLWMKISTI